MEECECWNMPTGYKCKYCEKTDNLSESALIGLLDAKLDICKKALEKIAMGTSSEGYPWIAIEKKQMKDIAQKALREIDK